MKFYKPKAYLITNKTNMHVGSGESGFGVVDNMVQRDTITNMPVIFSSSLKGAIRDHFSDYLGKKELEIDGKKICGVCFESIFGAESNNEQDKNISTKPSSKKVHHQGLVKFLDAKLVFLPLRSNKVPFVHVTSKEYMRDFVSFLKEIGIKLNVNLEGLKKGAFYSKQKLENIMVEDIEFERSQIPNDEIKKIMKLFEIENLAVMNNEDFNHYISNLPVIARNKLNNGKSVNLWYEEIVPRESKFVSVFMYYDNFDESDKEKFKNAFEKFEKKVLSENIQIGANESIGYGICKFKKIGEYNE
jgi:CRISPR-associated protein Cmr4